MAITIESSGAAAVTISNGTAASQYVAVFDAGFIQRLVFNSTLVAKAVLAEDTGTTNHTSRANYARQFLFDPVTFVAREIVYMVIIDGTTNAGSTDQDICNSVGDAWNFLCYGY
jgi:hypothetical protein